MIPFRHSKHKHSRTFFHTCGRSFWTTFCRKFIGATLSCSGLSVTKRENNFQFIISNIISIRTFRCVKCSYSKLNRSAFSRIRTEYREIRSIQSECRKMRTRVTPNTDTFHAVFSKVTRCKCAKTLISEIYILHDTLLVIFITFG